MATKVYVDAGHGGTDPGAIGINGVKESTITLAVAKYLQTELKRQGITVKMSREKDTAKALATRCNEANKFGANIVVSIHCNAHPKADANGTETFIYKKGGNAEKIANKVQPNLVSTLGTTNRDVKEGNLAMVRDTKAPAILCELAFITNKNDCAKLTQATHQKKCAVAICKGICSYLGISYKGEAIVSVVTNDYSKHWGAKAIQKMVDTKIMVGDGNGTFRPNDKITRAEVAQTIANLLDYLGK